MNAGDASGGEAKGVGGGRRRCPLCGRPAHRTWRPFCSRRCADLDLGRWLRGDYRVPTDEPAPEAEPGEDED